MIRLEVIGDPIEHSLSPAVHGAALSALGVEYEYKKVRVAAGGLKRYIAHAVSDRVDGFNLTMPHKVDILEFLSEISDDARLSESVNTVCVNNGSLSGFNTDGRGFELSLNRSGYEFKNSRIVILGAGGVVRTLVTAAALKGAKSVCVINRTQSKARELCAAADGISDTELSFAAFEELSESCGDADIFINATPLGMSGCRGDFENLEFLHALPKGVLVSDLIYNPPKTTLLKEAERIGLKTQNGLGMLIFQALAADEYYLERKLDMQAMYEKVINNL